MHSHFYFNEATPDFSFRMKSQVAILHSCNVGGLAKTGKITFYAFTHYSQVVNPTPDLVVHKLATVIVFRILQVCPR